MYDNVPLSVPIFIFVMVILGVAELGNSLFVIGGNDGTSFLNSCEHYDPLTNRWSYVPPMSRPRAGVGAAVVDGILYVAGMSNHNTIVRYNIFGLRGFNHQEKCNFLGSSILLDQSKVFWCHCYHSYAGTDHLSLARHSSISVKFHIFYLKVALMGFPD